MGSIKTGMIFLLCLYAAIGEGQDQKEQVKNALNYLSNLVGQKYQLSTTGYHSSMKDDPKNLIVPARRAEYNAKAKEIYPTSTSAFAELVKLQKDYINCVPEGGYVTSSPHDMNESQLTSCLKKVREKSFANCDMQALEVAIHIYALGFKDFVIISNKKLSHNYVLLKPTTLFPNGAIVDSWTGRGFIEMSISTKKTFSHYEANIDNVEKWMEWLKKNAVTSANNAWIVDIRRKFFRGISVPLQTILIPVSEKK